jgi:hypothetical protein
VLLDGVAQFPTYSESFVIGAEQLRLSFAGAHP